MAKITFLNWEEIPSVVEASDGDSSHKEQLSQRFQDLIDLVAMKKDLAGTDAYLEKWNKTPGGERDGSVEEAAKAAAQELEDRFDDIVKEQMSPFT